MLGAMTLAAALLGSGAGPASVDPAAADAAKKAAASAAITPESCPAPSADSTVIVICTQRPQGYRLNPDVMEAKRETRSPGRPVRPNGVPRPDCASVGPFPCTTAGIPLLGAAMTAAEMAARLAKGKEIGSMFVTDPHPTEYQLYQMAKARREAEDAEEAAAKKAKAAAGQAGQPQPAGN